MNLQINRPPAGRTALRRSAATLALALLSVLGLLAASGAARAQGMTADAAAAFPSRPVRLVVPYPPGGAVDIITRQLGKQLGTLWNQPVVVDNKPGASGMIAGDVVAKSPGDGYNLLVADDGVLVSMPFFQKEMPYNPQTDLVPVGVGGGFPYVVMASSKLNVKSMKELIDMARAKPGSVDFATNGVGGPHHLLWERMQSQAGIKLTHIPYKGAVQALQDVVAGRVGVTLVAVGTAFPYVRDNRLVPLAVGTLERSPILPDVPTLAEAGIPGIEAISWLGVMASKATPPELIDKINRGIRTVTATEEYRDALTKRGNLNLSMRPKEVSERMRREEEATGRQIKTMGLNTKE